MITILCFYLVSVPLAAYQALVVKSSIAGIWLGYFTGITLLLAIVAAMTLLADWHAISLQSEIRIVKDETTLMGEFNMDYQKLAYECDDEIIQERSQEES